jgi:transcriptional regulator with XRE-family HTH domain
MKTIEQVHEEIQAALKAARKTHEYRAEGASIEFTNAMVTRMREAGVSRSELARKIGVSPAYISKLLRGATNFSLDSMVKIAHALNCEFRCHLEPVAAKSQRFDGHRAGQRKTTVILRAMRNGRRRLHRPSKRARRRLKSAGR